MSSNSLTQLNLQTDLTAKVTFLAKLCKMEVGEKEDKERSKKEKKRPRRRRRRTSHNQNSSSGYVRQITKTNSFEGGNINTL